MTWVLAGERKRRYTSVMKKHTTTHKATKTPTIVKAKCIKLGIDVHAESYRVVRQIDDSTPQPAQNSAPESFCFGLKSNWRWPPKFTVVTRPAPWVTACTERSSKWAFIMSSSVRRIGTS